MDGKGETRALSLILERLNDLRGDQKATTEAVVNFGIRLTGMEERFLAHQVICEERYGQRMERMAERVRELGAKVDGQEITHKTSAAALEAEHRAMEAAERKRALQVKIATWGAGVLVTVTLALLGWLVFK